MFGEHEQTHPLRQSVLIVFHLYCLSLSVILKAFVNNKQPTALNNKQPNRAAQDNKRPERHRSPARTHLNSALKLSNGPTIAHNPTHTATHTSSLLHRYSPYPPTTSPPPGFKHWNEDQDESTTFRGMWIWSTDPLFGDDPNVVELCERLKKLLQPFDHANNNTFPPAALKIPGMI